MSRNTEFVLPGVLALQLLVCMAMASTVACAASQEQGDREAVTGALDDLFSRSTLVERNGARLVHRPLILVKFERAGAESPLCPTGTAFLLKVKDDEGNEQEVLLPTGVPTRALPDGDLNDITWVAADSDYDVLIGLEDFYFSVFFHPFVGSDNRNYLSKPLLTFFTGVGPLDMRARTLLPEGVDYKYTIARVEKVGTGDDAYFRLLEGCDPLDPRIRVY